MTVKLVGAGLLLAFAYPAPAQAQASCDSLLPQVSLPPQDQRGITAHDLIELRNIGSPDASTLDLPSPLSVSPDGSQLAFVITRPDPDTNVNCRGLVILPLNDNGRPRLVDRGGEDIFFGAFIRGVYMSYGTPRTITPVWSADGQSVFFLKRIAGKTSLWRADLTGSEARRVAAPDFDIESVVRPDGGGKRLLFIGRPGFTATEQAIDREARSGWHFDERIMPHNGSRPQVRERDAPPTIFSFDPEKGHVSLATDSERESYAITERRFAGQSVLAGDGGEAEIKPLSSSLFSLNGLSITKGTSQNRCVHAVCSGKLIGVWRWAGNNDVVFMRHEGWNNEATALYRWTPSLNRIVLIRRTLDALQGCVAAAGYLLCTNERTTKPRQIVRVDVRTGQQSLLFDPNPEFNRVRLGKTQRLRLRNNRGLEAWGDLVLPPGYRRGQRVPLIVVQYHSRGFLRGGTNDEYPIFLFAQRGMAVLSIERQPFFGMRDPNLTTEAAVIRANIAGWSEHASLFSSIKTGIEAAIDAGVADPNRLGISGLSDGATLTRYALINAHLFKAAAISTCCLDPNTIMAYGGIAWAEENMRAGFPPLTKPDPAFWQPMSLAQNAERINTPILMQLADREYLLAMESLEALRERNKPVDLYIFPDEHHGKSQPVHRLAIYERSADWFAFWLKGAEDPAPDKQRQYRRWEAMRRDMAEQVDQKDQKDQKDQRLRNQASTSTSRMMR